MYIKNAIVSTLEPIEISLVDAGGIAKDDVLQYALTAGQAFPIVKVSNTIIKNTDIQTFTLKCGLQNPLPVLHLVINDNANQFRETDYIDANTEIRIWLGNIQVEQAPLNYLFKPVDVQVKNGAVIIKATLSLHTNKISICNGTISEMLTEFAKQTGLGIQCNWSTLLNKSIATNFVNVSTIDFINAFCSCIGITWFIDAEYNVCLYDMQQSIVEHIDKVCNYNFFTTSKPALPYKVAYTNNLDESTIFRFTAFGYDFIDIDNTTDDYASVEFDKSFMPTIVSKQLPENEFVDKPKPIDTDCLYFEAEFDPYKIVGQTFNIQVYTQMNRPKRMTLEQYQSGLRKDMSQQLIEDISGIYMLTDVTYIYNSSGFTAWTAFQRPSK